MDFKKIGLAIAAGTIGHFATSFLMKSLPGVNRIPENMQGSVSFGVAFGITTGVLEVLK